MYLLFFKKEKARKELCFYRKKKKKKEIYKERMKKKKEFFRIRKDRKRKNGANARACTYTHRQDSPRPFAAFQIRERKPLTGFFIPTLVLFSKLVRVSEPTLFCFLNRSRAEALTRARVYVHSRTHPPPTSENSQERRSCPFQALQGGCKPFYGRDR